LPWDNSPEKRRQDSQRYGAEWRRKRLACLRAAKWHCEIRLEGVCIGAASEVDHIDGAENDPQHRNLRAACKPCHAKVTAQQGKGYRKRSADPPCSPRTKWW
jgi:5-methylcytosine-specific restriction endonuclease McrA